MLKKILRPDMLIKVYRMPVKLTNGFCFGDGVPIEFMNVDWFGFPAELGIEELKTFIRRKVYAKYGGKFLVLSSHETPEFTFVFEATVRDGEPK